MQNNSILEDTFSEYWYQKSINKTKRNNNIISRTCIFNHQPAATNCGSICQGCILIIKIAYNGAHPVISIG